MSANEMMPFDLMLATPFFLHNFKLLECIAVVEMRIKDNFVLLNKKVFYQLYIQV